MPPQIITLVRHGQASHNVDEQYHLRDPYLTELGESQCRTLPSRFHNAQKIEAADGSSVPEIDLLVTSPLKRTLQTTLLGFPGQISSGVPVIALPDLQETSDMPCDTGSSVEILKADPKLKTTDYGDKMEVNWEEVEKAGDAWFSKEGIYGATPERLKERAERVRKWLKSREEQHVVCVLHGGFLHYLTEDWTGSNDLPGTGWTNTEFRNFNFSTVPGEETKLVETEHSQKNRTNIPLGKTEMKQFIEVHLNAIKQGENTSRAVKN
ncbi:histidine phosphatase superfamily [Pyronema omphalodes]|nr:histidine phosphatase superfamily [Pyronema omphalodes]